MPENISSWPNGSNLSQLAALSANDIWAVGQAGGASSAGLIQHWDGRIWQTVTNPSPPNTRFNAISARAPDDLWVVGTGEGHNCVVEHWDGTQWRLMPTPLSFWQRSTQRPPDVQRHEAVSADDIWMAGTMQPAIPFTDAEKPLFAHWDGHNWSIIDGPSVDATVSDAVALGPDDVWAVGTTTGPG